MSIPGVKTVRVVVAVGSLFAITLAGCGPAGPKLYPVQGRVTLTDGTPIANGYVILHADKSQGNESMEVCHGAIKDGSYKMTTGAREGAPLGAYYVAIEAAQAVNPDNPYVAEWLAHEKYVDPTKSKLAVEVVENPEPGRYDFQLDPHPSQKKGR